jgi:hypothetical protein
MEKPTPFIDPPQGHESRLDPARKGRFLVFYSGFIDHAMIGTASGF